MNFLRKTFLFITSFPLLVFIACGGGGSKVSEEIPDGEGRVTFSPVDPVRVSTPGTWSFEFTVGPSGIRKGGGIVFQVSPWWGWSQPQTVQPEYPGYTSFQTDVSGVAFEVQGSELHHVIARVSGADLPAGSLVEVVYGDTQDGEFPGAAAVVDRYAEDEEEFTFKVDGNGDSEFAEISEQPQLSILAGPPGSLLVTAQSLVQVGESVSVRMAAIDSMGNWSTDYEGNLEVWIWPRGSQPSKTLSIGREEGGTAEADFVMGEEGVFRIIAEDPKAGFQSISNPILVQKDEPEFGLYWGDLQIHSGISDGTGTPEGLYEYARDVSALDIASITDHDAFGVRAMDEHDRIWKRIQSAAATYHAPHRFVTFLGFEWTSWTYGHYHVLYLRDDAPLLSNRDPESESPAGLWKSLEGLEAITIPHHPGGGPVGTDWAFYNPEFEPIVEICSIHGSSESKEGDRAIYNPREGSFVTDAWLRGYRLGVVGSGDSHNGHPGQRDYSAGMHGLAGIYARELTRKSVFEAIRERRVYATTGPRIVLDFKVNGRRMGSEFAIPEKNPRVLFIHAVGAANINSITVLKDTVEIASLEAEGREFRGNFLDRTPHSEEDFYVVRVNQDDGEMAWSSPVWVKSLPESEANEGDSSPDTVPDEGQELEAGPPLIRID